MPRLRNALVISASVILIGSSGAHSLLGWPSLRAKLVSANASAELVQGLAMGWHFAGLSMLVLGILTALLGAGALLTPAADVSVAPTPRALQSPG